MGRILGWVWELCGERSRAQCAPGFCLTPLRAWMPNQRPWEQSSPQGWREKGEAGDGESQTHHFSSQKELVLSQGCVVAITLVAPLPSDVFQVEGKSRECHVRNANKNIFLDFLLLCTVCQNLCSPPLLFCLWMCFMLLSRSSGKRRSTCCEFT